MKESTRHRRAFDRYARLGGGRSLEALHDAIDDDPSQVGLSRAPTLRTLESWSAAFHWQDRMRELEREAAARDQEDLLERLREMNERHAREGLALQQKGVERLHQLPPEEMDASDAIRSLVEGVRMERLARDAPTENVREEAWIHGSIDLTSFTEEELRILVATAERGATGAGEEEPE